ncbi:MAG: hypothetical protein ACOYZ7_09350 [Chloroflexota bacterium]
MSQHRRNIWIVGLVFLAMLILPSLACEQAGEVLSPEDATTRAREAAAPTATKPVESAAEFQVDDTVEFVGTAFLVPIYRQPGDRTAFSHAGRGDTGTVLGSQELDGKIWYLVKSTAGEGWIEAQYLQAVGAAATPTPAASEGPQVGDTVYLTGKAYLINIVSEPGSTRMLANQERGVAVVILDSTDVGGETWYKIDAPAGEGWVKAENISTEKP